MEASKNSKTRRNVEVTIARICELAASNWFESRQGIRSSNNPFDQFPSVPFASWRDLGAILGRIWQRDLPGGGTASGAESVTGICNHVIARSTWLIGADRTPMSGPKN